MKILSKQELQKEIIKRKDDIISVINEHGYNFADLYTECLSMGLITHYETFCFYVLLYCNTDNIKNLKNTIVNFNHEYWYIDKQGNSVQADFLFELFTNAQDGYYIIGMQGNSKNGAVLDCIHGNVKDLIIRYVNEPIKSDEELFYSFYSNALCDRILPTSKEFYEYVKSGKGLRGTFTGYTQENGFAVFEKPKELPIGLKEFLISHTQKEIDNLLKKNQLNSLEELAEYTDFSIEELQKIYNNGVLCMVDRIKEKIIKPSLQNVPQNTVE